MRNSTADSPAASLAPPAGDSTLQVMAQLSVNLGRLTDALTSEQHRKGRLWEAIRPIPGIAIPQITTSGGVADFPELLSPRTGYWWDLHFIAVETFSAGSVLVYLTAGGSGGGTGGALADSEIVKTFAAKGEQTYGKAQIMIPAGMRLVFSAVGISGNASPSIRVTEIAAWALPDYLL